VQPGDALQGVLAEGEHQKVTNRFPLPDTGGG
jgi:hypothetical protein